MQQTQPNSTDIIFTNELEAVSQSQPIDPDNPPWGFWSAMLVVVASIGLQIAVVIVLLLPYAFSQGLNPADPEFGEEIAKLASADKTAIFLQVFSILPAHVLTLGIIWCVVTGFGKRRFAETIGLKPGGLRVWHSALIGVVLFLVAAIISKLIGGDTMNQLEFIIQSSVATRYLLAFLAVATAPIVEELVYRGVLYSALCRLMGVPGAVFVVSALFTAIHGPQYRPNYGVILAIGLLSLALTLIRAYTKRLLPCVVVHLVFNAVQAILLVFTAPK